MCICPTCNSTDALYTRPGDLRRHQTTKHPPATPRAQSNLALILGQHPSANPNQWNATLRWLHQLQPEPPPYRTNLWRHLDTSTKRTYHHTLGNLYNWILAATEPHEDPEAHPAHQLDATPFWKMLITFDMMILHPRPRTVPANKAVRQRLSQFHQGNLQPLYEHALAYKPPTHNTTHTPDLNHAAQLAANEDNYHTAYARLTTALPVACITPEVRDICQTLYPPPADYQSNHRSTRHHTAYPHIQVQQEPLLQTLHHQKKGTAAGPFGDLPDTVKAFALYQPPHTAVQPYLQRFGQVLELILNHTVPDENSSTASGQPLHGTPQRPH
jgi:hypothetical protein